GTVPGQDHYAERADFGRFLRETRGWPFPLLAAIARRGGDDRGPRRRLRDESGEGQIARGGDEGNRDRPGESGGEKERREVTAPCWGPALNDSGTLFGAGPTRKFAMIGTRKRARLVLSLSLGVAVALSAVVPLLLMPRKENPHRVAVQL